MVPTVINLVSASLSNSSLYQYQRALYHYKQFAKNTGLGEGLPSDAAQLVLFAAFLHQEGRAPSTIALYIAAISFYMKLNGGKDPGKSFILRRTISGLKKMQPISDARLPITLPILHRLVESLGFCTRSENHARLFRSMFLLAFHGFLRIGEFTVTGALSRHTLQLDNCSMDPGSSTIMIKFNSFKHSTGRSECIKLQSKTSPFCPVTALLDYLKIRGNMPGPLFLSPFSNFPVSRNVFVNQLNSCLNFCGLSSKLYKSHSFRIGAATSAAKEGLSEVQIMKLGRWHSDAFLRYIR